jgi:hypothetical protein
MSDLGGFRTLAEDRLASFGRKRQVCSRTTERRSRRRSCGLKSEEAGWSASQFESQHFTRHAGTSDLTGNHSAGTAVWRTGSRVAGSAFGSSRCAAM